MVQSHLPLPFTIKNMQQNEPIDEISFLEYLTNQLGDEISSINHRFSNEQLNGLFSDVEKLRKRIEIIKNKSEEFKKIYGTTTTV